MHRSGAVNRAASRDRVLTVPNVLSGIRLALIPAFVWLVLVAHADIWAVAILAFSGASDWADGKIARLLDQSSRLGELLDPAVDRLYMVTVPIALGLCGILPWWIIAVLLARDALLAATLPVLRGRGLTALPVTYIGKAATFALMSAFPLILLGQASRIALVWGWAFLIWGLYMYLWTFVLYAAQAVLVARTMPKVAARRREPLAERSGRRAGTAALRQPKPRQYAQPVTQAAEEDRTTVSEIPADLHYTAEHEWVRRTGDDTVRVGITDFAQSALGDVVFVQLPDVGVDVTAGESCGEVESTKSVSDLYAPVSAKVVAVNGDLEESPQLVNSDPYGAGWLLDLRVDGAALERGFAALLDAEAYRGTLTE
jgi:cardiolipin synthase